MHAHFGYSDLCGVLEVALKGVYFTKESVRSEINWNMAPETTNSVRTSL
jgi:hypothetical protein